MTSLRVDLEVAGKDQIKPVAEYLPFVRKIAYRVARRLPSHVGVEDLIGAGVIGLMEAIRRYDSSRASNFEKFAEFRIKGAILDELRRRDLMARDARLELKKIEKVIGELTQEYGRLPEEEEVASFIGLDIHEYRSKLEKLTPIGLVSFQDMYAGGEGGEDTDPFELVAKKEAVTSLSQAIDKLNERQQQALQLYYVEDLTLKEVGEVLSVSESRVCQILSEASVRLRALMGPHFRADKESKKGE